jgi:hypothetical protein
LAMSIYVNRSTVYTIRHFRRIRAQICHVVKLSLDIGELTTTSLCAVMC